MRPKNPRLFLIASTMLIAVAHAQETEHSHHHPAPTQPEAPPPVVDHGAHDAHRVQDENQPLRDPDAYSGGYDFNQLPMRHDDHDIVYGALRAERFELWSRNGEQALEYDLRAGYGGDYNRATLRLEGQMRRDADKDVGVEAMWQHAIAAFWNSGIGMRGDFDGTLQRNWLAAGVHGVAPYWFELEATLYIDSDARTAVHLEGNYELLLTQRLILQPGFAASLYGKTDDERALGNGLAHVDAGVRLRYEIRRELAPYLGITWASAFGGTADYARAAGEPVSQWRGVVGVRFWY